MAQYRYRARRGGGELIEGTVEAPSADVLADQLIAGGLIPVHIGTLHTASSLLVDAERWWALQQRVRLDDLILLSRQLHTLIRAGVPIIRALRGLAETSRSPVLARVLRTVIEDIETGRDLSSAISRHPDIFPPLFCGLVQVGENSGRLDQSFAEIARHLGQEKETLDRVRSALRYPAFLLGTIAVAIVFLTLFVIPTFKKVYRSFGADLPWATRVILGVSDFAVAWWPWLLAALLLGVYLLRGYLKTDKGRLLWDHSKLRLPLAGSIVLRATMARFSRAFAMSLRAGMPLIQSINLTGLGVANSFVALRLERMRNAIERGETLTRSAAAAELFSPLVLQMIAVGEESGSVDEMLEEVAGFYEREVDYDLKSLSSAIEPILIICLGGVLLVLALGVFLPMWNLSQVVRGG
ncbi:MAG: type II secretion system F family protein [Desulfuromonadales bacterium]|nr:type II secretion system F family protein [Desulfuromonadales bacterium]